MVCQLFVNYKFQTNKQEVQEKPNFIGALQKLSKALRLYESLILERLIA